MLHDVCDNTWMLEDEDGEEVYHYCYLKHGHRGDCVCGYCEEGFDHPNGEVLDRA
jgi:hypothetical protein